MFLSLFNNTVEVKRLIDYSETMTYNCNFNTPSPKTYRVISAIYDLYYYLG